MTRRSNSDPIKHLKREISNVGLKAQEALATLPDWWEEAIEYPSGIIEIKGYLAKFYGLEIGPEGELRLRNLPHACFKTIADADVSEIASLRGIGASIARILSSAIPRPYGNGLPDASTLRKHILADSDVPWVDLNGLLKVCWEIGIPVAYLPKPPVKSKKMDGMVTFCNGRPVIFITKANDFPAWVLFVLAHEMGHIAHGHLEGNEGASIIDEVVTGETSSVDEQEFEANSYAVELLTGNANGKYSLGVLRKAEDLAVISKEYGMKYGIDPGHLVLNIAKNNKDENLNLYPLANKTLALLERKGAASELCRKHLSENIDFGLLRDESIDFLEHIELI